MENNKKAQSPTALELENQQLKDYCLKLTTLIDVNSLIVSSLDKQVVQETILDQTKILMECQEASVLLVDQDKQELYFALLSEHDAEVTLSSVRLKKGEGIAGKVWENGQPIITGDTDRRVSKKVDQTLDKITETLIATPLLIKGEVIGVMEAINKKDNRSFTNDDLEIFQTLANQAAIAIYNADLYEMATRDGMTKLFIRRYFNTRLNEEFHRSRRYKHNLSLIMFDIDHFKGFNDTYGHQLGDEVLIKTAVILMECCRNCDIAARYGGEEFCILLPETDQAGALITAERVRTIVEATEIPYNTEIIRLTISAGLTVMNGQSCSSPELLIKQADRALYYAKESGRNRTALFENLDKK